MTYPPSLKGVIRDLYNEYQNLDPEQRADLKKRLKTDFIRNAIKDAKGMLVTMALTASVLGGISGLDYLGKSTRRTTEWTVRHEQGGTVVERLYSIGGRTIYTDKDLDGKVDEIIDYVPRAGMFQRKISSVDQYVFSEKSKGL